MFPYRKAGIVKGKGWKNNLHMVFGLMITKTLYIGDRPIPAIE